MGPGLDPGLPDQTNGSDSKNYRNNPGESVSQQDCERGEYDRDFRNELRMFEALRAAEMGVDERLVGRGPGSGYFPFAAVIVE